MTSRSDFNERVIAEFRANGGQVGGRFAGASLLLLTTTGAKSGRQYTTPLVYMADGDRLIIFGSKGGAPAHPDWYHNLVAHPEASIEVGTETVPVLATVITGDERDLLYARQSARSPVFAEYQAKTKRQIPVLALQRRG